MDVSSYGNPALYIIISTMEQINANKGSSSLKTDGCHYANFIITEALQVAVKAICGAASKVARLPLVSSGLIGM